MRLRSALGGLALDEAAWARGCITLDYDLVNTGINEILN